MANKEIRATRRYTPSDVSVDFFNVAIVVVAGTLVYDTTAGDVNVITDAPAGQYIQLGNCVRIKTTSTATGISVSFFKDL